MYFIRNIKIKNIEKGFHLIWKRPQSRKQCCGSRICDMEMAMSRSLKASRDSSLKSITLQVPVSKPHPRSRAQRSHLWVPVTPASIVDLCFFSDGQRLEAKQRSVDATEDTKGEQQGMRMFGFGHMQTLACSHSEDGQLTDQRTGQDKWMYVWMRQEEERASSASWPELVKLEPAAETGCGSYLCTLFFICFNVWFLKEKKSIKNAWHSISRHFISWVGNSPTCFATRNVFSFHPADAEWAT